MCETAEITGESVHGGYAECIVALEEFVTPIPDSFDSAHAALLFCPGLTAYKAVKASEPCSRQDSWHFWNRRRWSLGDSDS